MTRGCTASISATSHGRQAATWRVFGLECRRRLPRITNVKCLTRGALAVAESAAPVLTQKETLLVVPEPRPRAMVLHPVDDDLEDLLFGEHPARIAAVD